MLVVYVFEDVYYRTKLREDSEKWFERVVTLEQRNGVLVERLNQHQGQVKNVEQRVEENHQFVVQKLLNPLQLPGRYVPVESPPPTRVPVESPPPTRMLAPPSRLAQPVQSVQRTQSFESAKIKLQVLNPDQTKGERNADPRGVLKSRFGTWQSSEWRAEYHATGNAETEQKCFERELFRARSEGASPVPPLLETASAKHSATQGTGRRAGVVLVVCAEVMGVSANLTWLHDLKATCRDMNLYIYLKRCTMENQGKFPEVQIPENLSPCT
ncbi:hypothetical protein CYMTET_23014, partial [Cymbomonas tetramitiformis]